ncbi:lipid II flippase Amj family protein [Desulforamulus aquiferis]|uniref:Lipid II flippase Amj n=1 Tax=Desulforamulus aquiferis TaxID=1397668 RepID=A0AAW7ZGG8_9FIRM|nr:lipid II flippase Amj family protein [Desulforamulus aquiferis]MDO7788426.1 lipid II flippase Amj family protein [Desulforamulus aquiferis]
MDRLMAVVVLTAIIHLINTLIYAVRPAGVTTQRLATAYSLFNVIFLVAQTANMLQAPLLSSIIEHAIARGQEAANSATGIIHTAVYQQELVVLDYQIRTVILGATLGTLIGAIFIPTFITFFTKGIYIFDQVKSVPKMIGMVLFSPLKVAKMARDGIKVPKGKFIKEAVREKLSIPRKFLVLNIIVTGIYTTSVLSSLYAGALFPEFRATATLLSGIINGMATILFATVVDPTAAGITDQAMRGERPERDVKQMSLYLALTRLLGTLLAQLFFVPAAYVIKYVAEIIARGGL